MSDVGQQLHTELIESKAISKLLSYTSRYSGHLSGALLTLGLVVPVTAPVTIPTGVLAGKVSFGSGVAGATFDAAVHRDTTSATGFLAVDIGAEFLQNNLTNMLPPPAKPFAYTAMEIEQTVYREAYFQMGQQ